MCGIFFSTKKISNIHLTNQFKSRGPDKLSFYNIKNYYFCHSLLHITGEKTKQPFIDKEIICIILIRRLLLTPTSIKIRY